MSDAPGDEGFLRRRDAARERLDGLFGAKGGHKADRSAWFDAVYDTAEGDPAAVPWADLAPKQELTDWLADNAAAGESALDIGCGLGDNAEALAAAGYRTTAFDLSATAIQWARARFPQSPVDYRAANLFDPPPEWLGAFDLVHECYTLQALHGELRENGFAAVARFVAPGGRLLVITRSAEEGTESSGPPWPLVPSELARFAALGLTCEETFAYEVRRGERVIPHIRAVWRRGNGYPGRGV
jgi:SAM-dependent methyltransferase